MGYYLNFAWHISILHAGLLINNNCTALHNLCFKHPVLTPSLTAFTVHFLWSLHLGPTRTDNPASCHSVPSVLSDPHMHPCLLSSVVRDYNHSFAHTLTACHVSLRMRVFSRSVVSDSCDPIVCSPPGSSVHGLLQARILQWVATSQSRGSSWPGSRSRVSCIAGRCFTDWTRRGPHLVRLTW